MNGDLFIINLNINTLSQQYHSTRPVWSELYSQYQWYSVTIILTSLRHLAALLQLSRMTQIFYTTKLKLSYNPVLSLKIDWIWSRKFMPGIW